MTAPASTRAPARTAGGSLTLALAPRGGRTVATTLHHRGALRTLRPHYPVHTGAATWTLINPGGGYLSGDRYDLAIDLAPGAQAVVIGQSATKIYRCPTDEVIQTATIRLDPGVVLDWRAEPLIAYAGSRYRQHTRVVRDPGSILLLGEIVTPGWAPDGSVFGWSRIHLLTEIHRPDAIDSVSTRVPSTLDFLDNLLTDPLHDDPADEALIGAYIHTGTLLVFDPRIDTALVEEIDGLLDNLLDASAHGDARVGIGVAPGPGLVLRVLATSSEHARAIVDSVADTLTHRWFGRAPLDRHQW